MTWPPAGKTTTVAACPSGGTTSSGPPRRRAGAVLARIKAWEDAAAAAAATTEKVCPNEKRMMKVKDSFAGGGGQKQYATKVVVIKGDDEENPQEEENAVNEVPGKAPQQEEADRIAEETTRSRPSWRLVGVREQRMLQIGLVCLSSEASAASSKPLWELPRRGNGSHLVLRPAFFERLLNGSVEFKSCHESDVCGSQTDLKHLDCAQLLFLRAQTVDFGTQSSTHSGRTNFLNSLDLHMFEKLARFCVRLPADQELPSSEVLYDFGLRIAIYRGVIAWLEQETKPQSEEDKEVPTLPECWVLPLQADEWGGCSAALLHGKKMQVDILSGDEPDFAAAAAGSNVAVVSSRAPGGGQDRRLHWDITSLDPQVDNIMEELRREAEKAGPDQAKLSRELSDAMQKRCKSEDELKV